MLTPPTPLVLASTSKIRTELLKSAGLVFSSYAPKVDEDSLRNALRAEGVKPRDQADALAEAKAKKVANHYADALVIGADQILDLDGEVYSKPDTPDALKTQLAALSGRTHRQFSAAVIYEDGRPVWRHISDARLTMRALSYDFIRSYVDVRWDTIRHSAGGYLIEADGIRLFSALQGSYHAVLGLPLIELLSYLSSRGMIEP